MTVNPTEILGGRISIIFDNNIVIENLVTTEVRVDQIPPYDHFVYAFTARTDNASFQNFYDTVNSGVVGVGHAQCKVSNGFAEIDAYIDNYEIRQDPINIADMSGGQYSLNGLSEAIIYGHVDSRSLVSGYNPTSSRVKKKKPEPITSRFDILDL